MGYEHSKTSPVIVASKQLAGAGIPPAADIPGMIISSGARKAYPHACSQHGSETLNCSLSSAECHQLHAPQQAVVRRGCGIRTDRGRDAIFRNVAVGHIS